MKTCPDCAESVQAAARVCRYCGYRFAGADEAERQASDDSAGHVPLCLEPPEGPLRVLAQARKSENQLLVEAGDSYGVRVLDLGDGVLYPPFPRPGGGLETGPRTSDVARNYAGRYPELRSGRSPTMRLAADIRRVEPPTAA